MKQQIELSNGAVYEVEGPANSTRQQWMEAVAAQLSPADHNVLKTKNDDFGSFLRERATQPIEGEGDDERRKRLVGDIPLPQVGIGQGALRAGFQGVSYGRGDELIGAGVAGLDALTGKTPEASFGDLYDTYVNQERDRIDSFRDSNPIIAAGAEIAGAIPTAIATGGSTAATQGVSLLARATKAAGIGGAQGAVYGFNAGEGGLGPRAQSGAVTGLLGGGFGAAAPPVAAGGANLYRATVGTGRAARNAGVSRPTYEALSDVVGADRLGAPLANQALLAERGPTATAMLDYLGQRPGASQGIVRDAVDSRVADATQQVENALDVNLGAPRGVRATARNISRQTAPARQEAYDAAYNAPIDYASEAGRNIESVLSRIPRRVMRQATQQANEAMQAEGIVNRQILINAAPDGAVTFAEMPNVQQLDYLKRALGEIGQSEVDNVGRPTGAGIRARNMARSLRDAVVEAVPDYAKALKLGGDKIDRDNGLRLGARLLSARTTREEVKEFVFDFRQMPDDVTEAIQTGLRSHIDDAMANVKRTLQDPNVDAREAAKIIKDLSSRANRDKLSLVLGDKAAAELLGEIDQAAQAFNLQASTVQNSKTAVRQMFDDRLNPEAGSVEALLRGNPVSASRALVSELTGRSPQALRQASDTQAAEMARLLTQTGAQGRATISRLGQGPKLTSEAEHTRRLIEQLLKKNVGVTGPVSAQLDRQ